MATVGDIWDTSLNIVQSDNTVYGVHASKNEPGIYKLTLTTRNKRVYQGINYSKTFTRYR